MEYLKVKLGEICKINQLSYSQKDNWDVINYLDTGNIIQNVIDEIQELKVGVDKIPSRAKRKVQIDDIIYSTVRPNQLHYGIIKSMPQNLLVSTGFAVISVDKAKADADYIYYYITQSHITESLHAIGEQSTSAYPSIKPSDLECLELDLPPLEVQRKIAFILRTIEEKMALNSRLNANLEEQISVLFNKYYENAENEVTLSECCSLTSSKRVFAKDYVQEGIPFYRGKEITLKRNGQQISDLLYISEEHYETIKSKYGVPMEGDILITAVGTLGNSYLVQQEKFYVKDGNVIWLKDFNNSEENYYIYDYMQSRMFRNAIDSIRIGSTQAALTIVSLGKLKVIVPNKAKLKEYYNISKAIRNKINTNIKETEKLIEIRNTLLPKLMSGSINLSDI